MGASVNIIAFIRPKGINRCGVLLKWVQAPFDLISAMKRQLILLVIGGFLFFWRDALVH
jgi:hypothetical protein